MNPELEKEVRDTLRDGGISWSLLVAEDEKAKDVLATVEEMLAKINADLASRKSAMAGIQESRVLGDVTAMQFSEASRQYSDWRRRVLYFKGLLETRRVELRRRFETPPRNWKQNYQREREQNTQLFSAVAALSTAIYAHEFGDLSDDDLHGRLSEIFLPFGKGDVEMSLRDAIDAGKLDRFFNQAVDA